MSKIGGNPMNLTYRIPKGVHISSRTEFAKGHKPFVATGGMAVIRGKNISRSLKGHTVSDEARLKIKAKRANQRGSRNLGWKGGISNKEYIEKQRELKAGRPKPLNCEICFSPKRIVFDHCHLSGKFRGWICTKCNLTLGVGHDDIKYFELLVEYLKKNQ